MTMTRSVARIALVLPPALLLLGSLWSDALAATASIILVVGYVAALVAGWWPGFVAAALANALALPVLLSQFFGIWSAGLSLVALPAIAHGMAELSPLFIRVEHLPRRTASPLMTSLSVALAFTLVLAVMLVAYALALAAGILLAVLAAVAGVQCMRLGASPLRVEPVKVSVRAGERVDIPVQLRTQSLRTTAHAMLYSETGAVFPEAPFVVRDETAATVSITPLLGGPTNVAMHVSIAERTGLVQSGQNLNIADMNVIPRARVARSAAAAFLAHGAAGTGFGNVLSGDVARLLAAQGGVEYSSSRMYVPGDSLRTVDWKHTARLQSLVTKAYDDQAEASGLLLAGLSACNAEEADRLVYELLSAALTIASMARSASLAVYDHRGHSVLSPTMDGSRLVSKVLNACATVRITRVWHRASRPLSAQEAEARVARVRHSRSEAAPGLALLLDLGGAALRRRVEGAAATVVLQGAMRLHRPAWCVAVSTMHNDSEAVLTGLRHMEQQGVRTLLVDVHNGPS